MQLTDSHCHIDFDNFSEKFEELLHQCYQNNIHQIIVPSVSVQNWDKVLELSNNSKCLSKNTCKLYACLGIHPWFLNELDDSALVQLSDKVAKHSDEIVAIGEAGIDSVISQNHHNLDKQIMFFEHQLALSKQHNLPIIVHHRRSHDIIVPLLKKYQLTNSGVIHAFSGSYQQAKAYLDLGFKLGVGGTITYERAQKTIQTIKKVPLDSILLETDAPSMPLHGFQGEHNSPLRLVDVLTCLENIRTESLDVITQTIENNVQSLFFSK